MFKRFRVEQRLVVDSTLFGVLLTLLVAAADSLGLLSPLERWLYDERAALCQRAMPPPTDRLVHVDIDDAALESIGWWPWDRSVLADIVDEIRLAAPKAVALDVLFSEPQESEWQRLGSRRFVEVEHDKNFAAALGRLGSALVGGSIPFVREKTSPVYDDVRRVLANSPEVGEADVVAALRGAGVPARGLEELVHADFYRARGEAIFDRIAKEDADLPPDKLLARVLPGTDPSADSPLLKAFQKQHANAQAAHAMRRLALPYPAGATALFPGQLRYAPVAPFGLAASAAGFVDYPQSSDGKVRAVPLFVESGGVVYPQLGLALACKMLGTDPAAIRFEPGRLMIPRPSLPDLAVPVRTLLAGDLFRVGRDVPLAANVSWFGGPEWERMYDWRRHESAKQHLSIAFVWDACLSRQKIVRNHQAAEEAWGDVVTEDVLEQFTREKLNPDDAEGYAKRIATALANVNYAALEGLTGEQAAAARRTMDASAVKLRELGEQNRLLAAQLRDQQAKLRSELGGRAVLIGWTATASIADFLPTSLHPRCPGVVLHGVIFSQIITGEVWRTLPPWATLLVTLALGLLTTLAVSFLSPGKAAAAAIALVAGYLALNGYLLFDRLNLVLGAAGPAVAIAAVWSGGTLAKLGMERWERARITRRFRSYADPKLVDYVLKHPEQNVFEGQVRELTVVYVDLVGFTQLTEKMGAEAVQLLNELWETLVPVIKRNDALVNKFLGDGMMFFYGAPEQSPHHARDAVATILDVQEALAQFNARSAAGNWPRQALRFGISTGTMVVGDSGAPAQGRTDYTVIGDYANLGARLESANKAVGTESLMTERTVELAGEGFLFRPVGKLCVVGKLTGVMTYEVLARAAQATDGQKALASDTSAVVDAFLAGRLPECVEALDRMEAAHGRSKLTALYRDRCRYYLEDPDPLPFDCQIVLTEK